MPKRGEISLWFTIELLAAILVGYLLVSSSVAYAGGTYSEKLNLAKDISMLINTILAVPGDSYIIKKNPNSFSVMVKGNKVEVFEDGVQNRGIYYFASSKNANTDLTLSKPKQIVISKIDEVFKISDEIPAELK